MMRLRDTLLLVTLTGCLILSYGFMQLRIPPNAGGGLPLVEIVLLLSLLTFNYSRIAGKLSTVIPVAPLGLWWSFGIACALIGFARHGIWALRDAVHVLESLFLLAGFVVAGRDPERFWRWLPRLLVLGALYGLLAPIQSTIFTLSPQVISGNGNPIAVFGSMNSAPYLLIMAACYLLLFRGNRPLSIILAALLIGYTIAVFQARTLYLVLIAVFVFLILYRRAVIGHTGMIAIILATILGVVTLSGLTFSGRLGYFSGEFLIAHFMAIFGYCDGSIESVCSAAEGVGQRIDWWSEIFSDLQHDAASMMFGLGYGVPLTDFYSNTGAQVREPHNSYISLLARTGVAGAICWLLVMGSLIYRWHATIRQCRYLGWREGENRLLILMVFFISMWVLALGEDGFEKPYNIVPFYFFWGIVLRMAYELRSAQEARVGAWTIRPRPAYRVQPAGDAQVMKVMRSAYGMPKSVKL